MQLNPFKPNPLQLFSELHHEGDKVTINYTIQGAIQSLVWPKKKDSPQRSDNLWKGTCFELFLAHKKSKSYLEFNFCPSGDWACYLFEDYRKAPKSPITASPKIHQRSCREVNVSLEWPSIVRLIGHLDLLEGSITACLKHDHHQSLWAIQHPPKQADFHNRRTFMDWGDIQKEAEIVAKINPTATGRSNTNRSPLSRKPKLT